MEIRNELVASQCLQRQSNTCCHKSQHGNTVQENGWASFGEDTIGRPAFFLGVYKAGLIDEHLVRVWKSGEDVREKKCDSVEALCKRGLIFSHQSTSV